MEDFTIYFVKFLVITTQCSSYMPQITITWNLQVYEVSHISKWDTKIDWYPNKNNHPYASEPLRLLAFKNCSTDFFNRTRVSLYISDIENWV